MPRYLVLQLQSRNGSAGLAAAFMMQGLEMSCFVSAHMHHRVPS